MSLQGGNKQNSLISTISFISSSFLEARNGLKTVYLSTQGIKNMFLDLTGIFFFKRILIGSLPVKFLSSVEFHEISAASFLRYLITCPIFLTGLKCLFFLWNTCSLWHSSYGKFLSVSVAHRDGLILYHTLSNLLLPLHFSTFWN